MGSAASASLGNDSAVQVRPREGMCLIICGDKDVSKVELVHNYFISKGLPTIIGRYNNRCVLVTAQGFPSNSSGDARSLNSDVIKLGTSYFTHQRSGQRYFTLKTLQGPYWVNARSVK